MGQGSTLINELSFLSVGIGMYRASQKDVGHYDYGTFRKYAFLPFSQ